MSYIIITIIILIVLLLLYFGYKYFFDKTKYKLIKNDINNNIIDNVIGSDETKSGNSGIFKIIKEKLILSFVFE